LVTVAPPVGVVIKDTPAVRDADVTALGFGIRSPAPPVSPPLEDWTFNTDPSLNHSRH
jgi:hypothetical protein